MEVHSSQPAGSRRHMMMMMMIELLTSDIEALKALDV